MKKTNGVPKIITLLCSVFAVIAIVLFVKGLKFKNKISVPDTNDFDTGIEVENNLSESVNDKNQKGYIIKLKEKTVMAYIKTSDGKCELWNSTPVSPDLSSEEIDDLKKGITVNSFEELCFYFEAYSS